MRRLEPMGIDTAAAMDAARARHEDEQRRLTPLVLRRWGVGSREVAVLLAGANQRAAVKHASDFFLKSTKESLFLWGRSGCGKSIAAASWLRQMGRRTIQTDLLGSTWEWANDCLFLSVYALARIQGSFDEDDRAMLDQACTARALVIDDLGTEPREVKGGLTHLLYERDRFGRKTVLTGNLSPENPLFEQRYGERAMRRLRQFGDIRNCDGAK